MVFSSKLLAPVLISGLALGACTELQDPERDKLRQGAAIGAVVGAVGGVILGGDNNAKDAAIGAAVGGAIGGIIGDRLDKQEEALRQDLAGSGATITNTGSELVVTLPEAITFETDSTAVRASLHDDLADLARNLQDYPESTVDVIGHTDSVGDASYNQNLSSRRSQAVNGILINNGVRSGRIRSYGRGETSPVASNDTNSGRAANRRVEVIIRPTA